MQTNDEQLNILNQARYDLELSRRILDRLASGAHHCFRISMKVAVIFENYGCISEAEEALKLAIVAERKINKGW